MEFYVEYFFLDMPPITEIIIQALWIFFSIWLIYRGYGANKKSKPFSLREQLNDASQGIGDLGLAVGLVAGVVLIILLINKLLTCGLICGTLLP